MPLLQKWLVSAAVRDLEIYEFDCKTTFMHAKLHHPLFARPRILAPVYGLRQSAYEFYMIILSLLSLGVVRCEGNRPLSRYAC